VPVTTPAGRYDAGFPKGTGLAVGQHRLDTIARYLNDMPRRSLHWDTATNRCHHLAANTT
jgi:IS30 family transposase